MKRLLGRPRLCMFFLALVLRLAVVFITPLPQPVDALEYYTNSRDLEIVLQPSDLAPHGVTLNDWQDHTPGYMLFCHTFHPVVPWVQAVLGASTCVLVDLVYPGAGWFVALWIPLIATTGAWVKVTVAGFAFALLWAILKRWEWWIAACLAPFFALAFFSIKFRLIWMDDFLPSEARGPLLHRLGSFWGPDTSIPWHYPTGHHLLLLPFVALWALGLFMFVRRVRLISWESVLFFGLCGLAMFFCGTGNQRWVFQPVLLGVFWDTLMQRGK